MLQEAVHLRLVQVLHVSILITVGSVRFDSGQGIRASQSGQDQGLGERRKQALIYKARTQTTRNDVCYVHHGKKGIVDGDTHNR